MVPVWEVPRFFLLSTGSGRPRALHYYPLGLGPRVGNVRPTRAVLTKRYQRPTSLIRPSHLPSSIFYLSVSYEREIVMPCFQEELGSCTLLA